MTSTSPSPDDTMTATLPTQSRVFVLELGMHRPLDYALGQGTHDLKECGVAIHLDGTEVSVAWLGHGPRAFLLPGARQLQKGQWQNAEDRCRVAWAGREWLFVAHELGGLGSAPPRGICLNSGGPGFAASGFLLVEQGPDRGNFHRFRTEPTALARGVLIQAQTERDKKGAPKDGSETLHLRLLADTQVAVALDGQPVRPGQDVVLRSEQVVTLQGPDAGNLQLRVIVP